MSASIDKLSTGWTPLALGNWQPFVLLVEDGVLYVNTDLRDVSGQGRIKVVKNVFSVDPLPGWDINSNEAAFEIVHGEGVLFQMIRKGIDTISIKCAFVGPGGLFIADDKGLRAGTSAKASDIHIAPVFKYPAWKYPGKYANE